MKRKPKRKIRIIITSIIVILLVVLAIFCWENHFKYLTITQKVELIAVELKSEFEPSVEEYIDAPDFVLDQFTIDASAVDSSKTGTYLLTVSDGRKDYDVDVVVEDTQAPTVTVASSNEFNVVVGGSIHINSVEEMLQIEDASEYTVCFGNDLDEMAITEESIQDGKFIFTIVVTDKYGNAITQEIEISDNLYVPEDFPIWYQVASENIQKLTVDLLAQHCADICEVEEKFGLAGWETVADVVDVQLEEGVDPFDQYLVYGELASMKNPELLQRFDDLGWKIIIAKTDGYLVGEDYGLTGRLAGVIAYDDHWIKLPGKRIDDLYNSNVNYGVCHEMGHFIDWYFGYPSKTNEFKAIYTEENERCLGVCDAYVLWINNDVSKHWIYDKQHTEYIRQNPEEYFAEFYSYMVHYQNLDKSVVSEYTFLKKNIENCPKTGEFIQNYIDKTETIITDNIESSKHAESTSIQNDESNQANNEVREETTYYLPPEDEYWWDIPVLPEDMELQVGEIPM